MYVAKSIAQKSLVGVLSVSMALYPFAGSYAQPLDSEIGRTAFAQADEALTEVESLLGLIHDQIDYSVFEVEALADKLGRDSRNAFDFVRDSIGYRAYFGSLRGADGVLIDRVGNSLDRALLLAALVAKDGRSARIAYGTLNAATAERLAARTFEAAPPIPDTISLTSGLISMIAETVGMGVDEVRTALQPPPEVEAAKAEYRAEFEPAFDELRAVLADSDIGLAPPPDLATLVAETQEHYWLQVADDAGDWIDLDPSFADAVYGARLTEPAGAFAPEQMPEALRHFVAISAVLSVLEDGSIVEKPVVNAKAYLADVTGLPITLQNVPTGLDLAGDLASVLAKAADFDEYRFVMALNGRPVVTRYFDMSGAVYDSPGGGKDATGAGAGLNSIAGKIRGLPGLSGGGEDKPKGKVVGLRVEYESHTSRGMNAEPATEISVRDIVAAQEVTAWSSSEGAALAPANRDPAKLRAGLVWQAQLALLPADPAPEYLGYRQLEYLTGHPEELRRQMARLLGVPVEPPDKTPPQPLPWMIYAIAAAVHAQLGPSDMERIAHYVARPTILAEENSVEATDTRPILVDTIDVAQPGDRTVSRDATDRGVAADEAVRIGVAWTTLERLVVDQQFEALGLSTRSIGNLIPLLAAARGQGIGLAAVGPDDTGVLAGLNLPPPIKADLANSLDRGVPVVTPTATVSSDALGQHGWWSFDVGSGIPIGRALGGRGAAGAEDPPVQPNATETEEAKQALIVQQKATSGVMAGLVLIKCVGQVWNTTQEDMESFFGLYAATFACLATAVATYFGLAPNPASQFGLASANDVYVAAVALVVVVLSDKLADRLHDVSVVSPDARKIHELRQQAENLKRQLQEQQERTAELQSR